MLSTKWFYAFACVCLLFSITTSSFAAQGFDYLPDDDTLGLWHFDDAKVVDASENEVESDVEGKAAWDANQVLSPNLAAPQAVEFTAVSLPIRWGQLKQ